MKGEIKEMQKRINFETTNDTIKIGSLDMIEGQNNNYGVELS